MALESLWGSSRSVLLVGDDRSLLNWIAYALASAADPDFLWTDVRTTGEVLGELDVFARDLIAPNRLITARPSDLAPSNRTANIAISEVVRDDEPPESLRRLLDFLRLPEQTQAQLSHLVSSGRPRVVVLSNAHRLQGFYPVETVAPLLRAIGETGVRTVMTFADAPNEGRFGFDTVLRVEGHDPRRWKEASLTVEKGPLGGPFRAGAAYRLGDFEALAAVLAKHLG